MGTGDGPVPGVKAAGTDAGTGTVVKVICADRASGREAAAIIRSVQAGDRAEQKRKLAVLGRAGHQAIEEHDLVQLRELLDAGRDAEDETQDGLTLLRHAVHREHTTHVERGAPSTSA